METGAKPSRLRRKHIWWIRITIFLTIWAFSPPWLWLAIMVTCVVLMALFMFGLVGLISPMPKSKVLTSLAKRHVMIANMRRASGNGS
jgi:hypothetical protein